MNPMVKQTKYILLLFILFTMVPGIVEAQCSMCRAVLESEADQSTAKGINDGILYLMIFPYLLIGGIGYFVYKTLRSKKKTN